VLDVEPLVGQAPHLDLPQEDVCHVRIKLDGNRDEDPGALAQGLQGGIQAEFRAQVDEGASLSEAGLFGVEVRRGGAGEPEDGPAWQLLHQRSGGGQQMPTAELLHHARAVHVEPEGLVDGPGLARVLHKRITAQAEINEAMAQTERERNVCGKSAHEGDKLLGSVRGFDEVEGADRELHGGADLCLFLPAMEREDDFRRPGAHQPDDLAGANLRLVKPSVQRLT
jgi:hypothetical protein